MKHSKSRPAFTLIEMLIAITVFTIFIGFAISTYLTFHRADQDALTQRSLIMDSEAILNQLSDAVRENKIDYEAYGSGSSEDGNPFSPSALTFTDALNEEALYLISADGEQKITYRWDADEETLSVQYFDADGTATTEEQVLHSEGLTVSDANFRVFPATNPYEDRTNDEIQYQPMVTFTLNFSMPGRVDPELTLELQTTVTSRYYQ